MKKAIYYSVVQKVNPQNPSGQRMFYAQVQARGAVTIADIAKRIQESSTVTRADIMGTLVALEKTICDGLANGEIVRLGQLGSLQMIVRSNGAPSEKEFNTSYIKNSYVLFRPGENLTAMLQTLNYQRVEPKPKKEEETDPQP